MQLRLVTLTLLLCTLAAPYTATASVDDEVDIWLNATEGMIEDGINPALAKQSLHETSPENFSFPQLIQFYRALDRYLPDSEKTVEVAYQIEIALTDIEPSDSERYALCQAGFARFCTKDLIAINPTQNAKDLYRSWLDLSGIYGGKYANVPRMYLFCRTKREYPCLMLMKDKSGKPVLDESGATWSQPLLAFSRHLKKFDQVGGNTPAGIFLVNGVMPKADQQDSFGKFRRLILEFVEKTRSDSTLMEFLPKSNRSETWWKESVIARDMGRSAFRVHGTLQENRDKASPHYGFYGTSGCVASRELKYDGIEYTNQQLLLNKLMQASGLEVKYDNEAEITALLYVTNINGEARAVSLADLKTLGIL